MDSHKNNEENDGFNQMKTGKIWIHTKENGR